ncbi:SCO family protein [Hymenobacter chitinivorans]|uniref:Protein SCO1/2 n=1 Tax=Hymenobacter chitinivorans DSM 11115 TaxID=1121954 RepID=A0A2M9BRY3_9BACT|nr:SCO family protein [Hymenobacter chitinivorans]PJJ60720.1 protein SCO1/2 [Hymenobacter chitinivorans DSM 11115]
MISFSFRRICQVALLTVGGALALSSCSDKPDTAQTLPYYGERDVRPRADGGPADTIFASIPSFTLTDQDGKTITNQTFAGKVYVADFFFATCPSICPKMQSEMLRVYEQFKDNPRVVFLSHTIDPAHDSIPVLRDYAQRLGIQDASRWHFATAPHDTIFRLAPRYFAAVEKNSTVAGGYAHSGAFALVDSDRHIRGVYDGMVKEKVDQLIKDLPVLLQEEAAKTKKAQ